MEQIIVVDDDAGIRKLSSRLLQECGYQVRSFCDGQEVVDFLKNQPISYTILMDYEMPRLNGGEATHEIRRMGRTDRIYGISSKPMNTEIFLEKGANGIIEKADISKSRIKYIDEFLKAA